jgi:hypothetical protein
VAGGGGRVVDFCMCVNITAGLLFRKLVNRYKGFLEGCCFGGWVIHRALDWIRHLGALSESWKLADAGGRRRVRVCPGLIGGEGKVWAGERFIVARKSKALRCVLHWAGRCCESV